MDLELLFEVCGFVVLDGVVEEEWFKLAGLWSLMLLAVSQRGSFDKSKKLEMWGGVHGWAVGK